MVIKKIMTRGFLLLPVIYMAVSGCTNNYYSEMDFKSVLKVDSHVHIETDDGIFEDQADDDNFLLLSINVDTSDSLNLEKQFTFASQSAHKNPGRVFYGASFWFDTAGWDTDVWHKRVIASLDRYIPAGAVTMKIWKNIGMTVRDRYGRFIMADDPGLQPVFDFIRSKGLPVTGHLGEPRNCWLPLEQMTVRGDSSYFADNPEYHMYLHPEYPSYDDQIRARDNMLERNPELRFIGCHLGSLEWNVDSLASRLDRYPNMAVDMAARICHLQLQSAGDRKKVRDFLIRYQDRLLYGTDTGYEGSLDHDAFRKTIHETWIRDWNYFVTGNEMSSSDFKGKFRGLHLPKDVVDKIYSKNAIRWYNLNIK